MEEKQLTAVEWLIEQFDTTINYTIEEYQLKIQQAKEMEKEQMFECIKFGTGVRSVMEEIVHDKISNSLKELVKQGKLKNYTNYKSDESNN